MDDRELSNWKRAGEIAGRARDLGVRMVEEDTPYLDVAEGVEEFIGDSGGMVAFPVNIAVNDIAAHYTPKANDRLRFSQGDLVKIDVGVHIDGCIGDTARTVEVGTNTYSSLIDASKRSLDAVIEVIRGGIKLSRIGSIVERTMNSMGFRPIINLTGHSIERYKLHAGLSVPSYDDRGTDVVPAGIIAAIEPFATTGVGEVVNGKRSNIYKFVREKEYLKDSQNSALQMIMDNFPHLPFSERSISSKFSKGEKITNGLLRAQAIYSFPILREISGGMVAQTEHTVYVTEKGCIVLTG